MYTYTHERPGGMSRDRDRDRDVSDPTIFAIHKEGAVYSKFTIHKQGKVPIMIPKGAFALQIFFD
jgi:hypothetical protein